MSPERAAQITVTDGGPTLRGEVDGDGRPIVLCHGLTATRRYVLHGSRALARTGLRVVAYDARGHGASDPAADPEDYGYPALADDLDRVIDSATEGGEVVLAGHSMGAHTITARALRSTQGLRALVIVGPVSTGEPLEGEALARQDALADGLERGGVDGFIEAFDRDLDPDWRDTVLRFTRERIGRHEHPGAVADAIRVVSRSRPFASVDELASVDVPALVVASHDEADPGHPYAVAEEWADALPNATLVSEQPGESPLAWQGARLSRAIEDFLQSH